MSKQNVLEPTSVTLFPRQTFDHGIMVFDCQPCLTMFGGGVTVECYHGLLSALDHGTLPTANNKIVMFM